MSNPEHWSSPNGCHEDCPACEAEPDSEECWYARVIADDGCEQEATGETAVMAVCKLLSNLLAEFTGDVLIGETIIEIGEALKAMEESPESESFSFNLGDFSLPSKLVVSLVETAQQEADEAVR